MKGRRAPRPLFLLGALLVLYLAYPLGAFLVRLTHGGDQGWHTAGLFSALRISAEGATISLAIGVLTGIPLAYVLAHRRGWLWSTIGVIVQLPLAVPPLVSGILLVYIVGPYTWLGQLSGERLTQTFIGVIIAQSFVSAPFLVIIARSAFRSVDPALGDVAATLGHGPLARFLRVEVPTAGDGIRAGMVLMWLRAFGEYGTVVVLAYHPYSLPVYVENLFSSAPLSQAEAPTVLAFGVAALAIVAGRARAPRRLRRPRTAVPIAPVAKPPTPVGFALDAQIGTFHLQLSHPERSNRVAIVGPSGSGKSLALQALAGLLGRGTGTVTFAGTDVSVIAPERRRLGYVPQGFGLMPGRTVWQQTMFGVDADAALATWWLQTLHLGDLLDRLPEQLSGGQRQRVGLARALAVDPGVLLLDEPFSALDAPVRAQLRRELRRLQRGVGLSTVLVTHDPEEAAILADEILVISDGRLLQSGTCRDVFQRPASPEVGRLLGIENLFAGAGDSLPAAVLPDLPAGSRLLWQVPPEALTIRPAAATEAVADIDLGAGRLIDIVDLGRSVELVVESHSGLDLRARTLTQPDLAIGDICRIGAPIDAIAIWTATDTP